MVFGDPGMLFGRLFPDYRPPKDPPRAVCLVPHIFYRFASTFKQDIASNDNHAIPIRWPNEGGWEDTASTHLRAPWRAMHPPDAPVTAFGALAPRRAGSVPSPSRGPPPGGLCSLTVTVACH
jgi:hypothetical protein